MGDLFEWLRRADATIVAALTAAFTAAGTSDEDQPVWSAAVAVVGGLLVLAGALGLPGHARLQLAVICGGLLLTVPHLQARFDRVRVAAED